MDIRSVHQNLKLQPENLAAAIELAPSALGIVARDDTGNLFIALANRAFRDLLGYSSLEAPLELTKILDRAELKLLEHKLAKLIGEQALELSFIATSGKIRYCEVSAVEIADTQPQMYVLTVADIAARKALEDQRLEAAGIEQREDFIATLTHDLKTPIVGANMVLTALLDGTLGPLGGQQIEIINKLKTSNQALLKMIHNLLEVYKYESGHSSLMLDEVDLKEVVRFCCEDVRPLVENRSQKLEADTTDAKDVVVCDKYAMQRVLVNLLGNATKFTPTGGTITVRLRDEDHFVSVQVTDTGSGIDPRDQHRLFQRFYQGEPGKRYAAGTGLGLYFCAHVARAHGGSISCDSTPGVGSTFTVRLPKQGPSSTEPPL